MATYAFGVRKAYIATWNSYENYGALVHLDGISKIEVVEQTTNAKLEGQDRVVATHAVATSARIALTFGLGPTTLDILTTITGRTKVAFVGYNRVKFGFGNYPYIGLVAQVYETGGAGDKIIRVPYMKALDGISFSAAYGGFVVNSPNFEAIPSSDTDGSWWLDENATALTALNNILSA